MDTLKSKLPPIGQLGPFIALVIACAIFGAATDRFFSGENFSLILQQVMVVGVIAIGQQATGVVAIGQLATGGRVDCLPSLCVVRVRREDLSCQHRQERVADGVVLQVTEIGLHCSELKSNSFITKCCPSMIGRNVSEVASYAAEQH